MGEAIECDSKTVQLEDSSASYLNDSFFEDALSRENLKLLSWKPLPLCTGESMIMNLVPAQEGTLVIWAYMVSLLMLLAMTGKPGN